MNDLLNQIKKELHLTESEVEDVSEIIETMRALIYDLRQANSSIEEDSSAVESILEYITK